MTLDDLTEQLSPQFPASVQKDVKTAVRILAQSLKYPDAKSCPLTDCLRPLADIYRLVEPHLITAGKGPHTVRNVKNNLSRLFRLADAQGLFPLPPAVLTRRFREPKGPLRSSPHPQNSGTYLVRAQWPAALEEAFAAFSKWATDPVVPGRDMKLRKRMVSMKLYQTCFEGYFGYLHHTRHIQPVTFDHLYDIALIQAFVHWHINEKHQRPTLQIIYFVTQVKALAHQYHQDPQLVQQLKALRASIPTPPPYYRKSDVWVPLHELRRVADALWPTKPPSALRRNRHVKYPGSFYALRAGLSLMFHLWTYIPYRVRNMCEMKLGTHLEKTPEGHWHIRFAGDDLKIGRKRGQLNVFDLPFPPSLTPLLETYLKDWRPILLRGQDLPHVFLNALGGPFNRGNLLPTVCNQVYAFTGKPWHPHIIRTVWATEWIKGGGDFVTAAIMLNDRLETVIANYSYLLDQNVAEKAYQWADKHSTPH